MSQKGCLADAWSAAEEGYAVSHHGSQSYHTRQSRTWMGWEARPGSEAGFVRPPAGRRALEHQGAEPPCYSKRALFSVTSPSDPSDR